MQKLNWNNESQIVQWIVPHNFGSTDYQCSTVSIPPVIIQNYDMVSVGDVTQLIVESLGIIEIQAAAKFPR
ncbi:hypothetical protein ACH3XW_3155 [Acanthocheilonema viteae]